MNELEEFEREEFFRLKKIQDKKKLVKERNEKLVAEARLKENLLEEHPRNLLDDEDDDDILF